MDTATVTEVISDNSLSETEKSKPNIDVESVEVNSKSKLVNSSKNRRLVVSAPSAKSPDNVIPPINAAPSSLDSDSISSNTNSRSNSSSDNDNIISKSNPEISAAQETPPTSISATSTTTSPTSSMTTSKSGSGIKRSKTLDEDTETSYEKKARAKEKKNARELEAKEKSSATSPPSSLTTPMARQRKNAAEVPVPIGRTTKSGSTPTISTTGSTTKSAATTTGTSSASSPSSPNTTSPIPPLSSSMTSLPTSTPWGSAIASELMTDRPAIIDSKNYKRKSATFKKREVAKVGSGSPPIASTTNVTTTTTITSTPKLVPQSIKSANLDIRKILPQSTAAGISPRGQKRAVTLDDDHSISSITSSIFLSSPGQLQQSPPSQGNSSEKKYPILKKQAKHPYLVGSRENRQSDIPEKLLEIHEKLISQSGIPLKEKFHFSKIYRTCVSGSDLLDFIGKTVMSRSDGIQVVEDMMKWGLLQSLNPGSIQDSSSSFYYVRPNIDDDLDGRSRSSQAIFYDAGLHVPNVEPLDKFIEWLQSSGLSVYADIFKPESERQSEEGIMFERNNSSSEKWRITLLKSSLQKLMELVIVPRNNALLHVMDHNHFIHVFLTTFPTFLPRPKLLAFLRQNFEESEPSRISIMHFMNEWLSLDSGADFKSVKMKENVKSFISILPNFGNRYSQWAKNFTQKLESNYNSPPSLTDAPEPILPKNSTFGVLDIDPVEMARQITLIMESKFLKIERREFLKKAYEPKRRYEKSRNLTSLLEFGQHITNVAIAEVLKQPYPRDQAKYLDYFIDVGDELRKFNNFFGMGWILNALFGSAGCLKKLRQAKKLRERVKKYRALKALVSIEGQYKAYQDVIDSIPPTEPCLPMFHISGLDAIVKLNEAEKDQVQNPSGWINWHKMSVLCKAIHNIIFKRNCKRYNLKPVKHIQDFIQSTEGWPIEALNCRISTLRNSTQFAESDEVQRVDTARLWDPEYTELIEKDWKVILASTQAPQITFPKSSVVLKSGAPGDYIYRLAEGNVEIKRDNPNKSSQPTPLPYVLIAPNIFGEMAVLLPDKELLSDMIAASDVVAFQIPIHELKKLLSSNLDLARKFYFTIAWKNARRFKRKLERNPMRMSKDVTRKAVTKHIEVDDSEVAFHDDFGLEGETPLREFPGIQKDGLKKTIITLIVTEHYFCFRGQGTFRKIQVQLEIANIETIAFTATKKYIQIDDIIFKPEKDDTIDQVMEFLTAVHKTERQRKGTQQQNVSTPVDPLVSNLELTNEDWDLILKSAQRHMFKPGETIEVNDSLEPGMRRLYRILKGKAIYQMPNTDLANCPILEDNAVFGEVKFLHTSVDGANVIAQEKTLVLTIEAYYLNILFQTYPELSAKFYKFLARILCERLLKAGYYS